MKLIYFAPVDEGGLAQYAVHQAAALQRQGADVFFMGQAHMEGKLSELCKEIPFTVLESSFAKDHRTRLGRKIAKATSIVRDARHQFAQVRELAASNGVDHLLISYYFEYLSPFWAGPVRRLRKSGMKIGTIVHDPVRDFQLGPRAWHRWSISQAYSFVDVAFVHDLEDLDTGSPRRDVSTHTIPHGLYEVPIPRSAESRDELRKQLGISEDAIVLLSFGHIRDGKNLDLLIKSIVNHENVHLLIVGREQSGSQRNVAWYQDHANKEGVSDRCHWVNRFVSDDEVHRFFMASDAIAMLYSSDFRSASGVLNNAAQFELPVLCSSGGGPLQDLVQSYALGVWVEPDSSEHAERGLNQLLEQIPFQDLWQAYRTDQSWLRNADLVLNAFASVRNTTGG